MPPCECGCGEIASARFIGGHQNRRKGPAYEERDCGYVTPCWQWLGSITSTAGYGCMRADGRTRSAHRVYYERAHGSVPQGMQLDHLCRNRACVNPAHLEPVSNRTNSRRGAKTTLTREQAAAIREDLRPDKVIAAEYGTTPEYVCNIRLGLTWPELGPPQYRRGPYRKRATTTA